VAKQGADAISDCGELIGYPITVSYSDSSFILSGTVPTLPHRALAAEIMKNVLAKDESTKNERINNSITIKPEQTFTSYIIRPGDNLGRIAGFFLGNSDLWPVITEYNKKIIPDPYHLKVGSSLKIPVNICR
jgi:nucleoid-associated protein YgaU